MHDFLSNPFALTLPLAFATIFNQAHIKRYSQGLSGMISFLLQKSDGPIQSTHTYHPNMYPPTTRHVIWTTIVNPTSVKTLF